jgi:hypothetical protein
MVMRASRPNPALSGFKVLCGVIFCLFQILLHKMPVGKLIMKNSLAKALSMLDIDEGVRIEPASKKKRKDENKKIFVNKNLSGSFVIQAGDENFYYLDSASQVIGLVDRIFDKEKYVAWVY